MNDMTTAAETPIPADITYEAYEPERALQTYVSDLLALEQHIGKPLDVQIQSEDTARYPEAQALVTAIRAQNAANVQSLQMCLNALGGHPASSIKSAWSSLLGEAAAAIGASRKTKVTKWLRDDYTALNLAAISYTLLYATAVGLGEPQTAAVAHVGLSGYARSIMQINDVIPDIVLAELLDDGAIVAPSAAETIRQQSKDIWKAQSSVVS
jgi:ferritin-like metal-binding protein YciE